MSLLRSLRRNNRLQVLSARQNDDGVDTDRAVSKDNKIGIDITLANLTKDDLGALSPRPSERPSSALRLYSG